MSNFKVEIKQSKIFPEVKILKPSSWFDYRGEMWTSWEQEKEVLPKNNKWKISKFTRSRKNVLRGLHGDDVTWKHISCVWGEIYLVVVDNRPDSKNYLKWESYLISDRNHLSVLVPPKFVNGHLCLSEECLFHYTQSYPNDYVDRDDQDFIRWDDDRVQIDWPINNPILGTKDK